MKNTYATNRILPIIMGLALAGCGGGGGGDTTPDAPANTSGISLSGSISIASSDAVKKATADVQALDNATVSVYKIYPDGTEELVGTTTADAAGKYSFAELDPASGGTGASDDFYYEVRASSGTLDIRAPAAPMADAVVDVTPASNLAAKILSGVVEVPDDSSQLPTPNPELIEATRELVAQNADALGNAITLPSAGTDAASEATAMANGLAAAGGNAEKMYKAAQFNAELGWLSNAGNNATAEQASAYMQRIIREACNQPEVSPLTEASAAILGDALLKGDRYTLSQLVEAFNALVPQSDQVTVTDIVQRIQGLLTAVDDNLDARADAATDFKPEDQLILYVKRGMKTIAADTTLAPDQALALFLAAQRDQNATENCAVNEDALTSLVAGLSGNATLAAPHVGHIQIFHDSGFGCNEGAGEGHFRASVAVFAPGVSVTGVTVTSSDSSALGGDGSEALTQQGNRWISRTDGICVTLGRSVTYTVSASLSDSTTVSKTITRNHPLVPEATAEVNGMTASKDSANPDKVRDLRPLYSWEAPAAKLATITDAPAGSRVKYRYEFAHIDVTDSPVAPLTACDSVPYGPMYAVDNFLPTVDCNPAACATAASRDAANISCRINIQTYLVSSSDKVLGQAAGNFTFFCVDSNGDGVCGD